MAQKNLFWRPAWICRAACENRVISQRTIVPRAQGSRVDGCQDQAQGGIQRAGHESTGVFGEEKGDVQRRADGRRGGLKGGREGGRNFRPVSRCFLLSRSSPAGGRQRKSPDAWHDEVNTAPHWPVLC